MIQQDLFLALVRQGIGTQSVHGSRLRVNGSLTPDWNALEVLAAEQGLSAVLVDGIERMPEGLRPPKQVVLQWIAESLQGYEYRYELYCRTIAELAAFYNEHDFKMMLLKGYACSMDWPKPEHRPCGDIDIWLFGQQQEADKALGSWFKVHGSGSEIDKDNHRHTIFQWRDFTVENHFNFVNVHAHKWSGELEKVFKELGSASNIDEGRKTKDDDLNLETCNLKPASLAQGMRHKCVELYGEKVYLPSPNLHALFLMYHMVTHFAGLGMTLRQLLDWAFFVKAHGKEIDWEWLEQVLERFGMRKMYDIFNGICVENLGFEVGIFHRVQFEPVLKERVLKEILNPEFGIDLPKGLLRSWIYRWRRWKAGAWKRALCYNETRWESFWRCARIK